MKKQSRTIEWSVLNQNELDSSDLMLVNAAKEATSGSWSPYSGFKVGAALLLDDGTVVTGSNQENAAYPSGLCAERVAVFHANAKHSAEAVTKLVIVAKSGGVFTDSPITPCGSCRQVLCETEQRFGAKMQILMYGRKECFLVESASCLLPLSFGSESLGGK
jgi:cytidine deaminase